jgi:prephenate dehydrogenase
VLIVGCGCRGRALGRALLTDGHAVRGTTRGPLEPIAADGIEGCVADPDRLGTIMAALPGVAVVCWLLGTARGENAADLHGPRLETLLERLVDTPVRGFVYEAGGGEEAVLAASERWRIAARVVSTDPARHEEWLAAMRGAVAELL